MDVSHRGIIALERSELAVIT